MDAERFFSLTRTIGGIGCFVSYRYFTLIVRNIKKSEKIDNWEDTYAYIGIFVIGLTVALWAVLFNYW